jgi:hypothetical protein
MAEAIEAGARGEATAATQRLAVGDYDATRAIDETSATRALPRTEYRGPQPTRVQDVAPPLTAAPARARRDDRDAARRAAGRRRFGGFLALLAALAAIVVVAVALLSSSDGSSVQPVDSGDPQQQIDGLRDFIREHSQP